MNWSRFFNHIFYIFYDQGMHISVGAVIILVIIYLITLHLNIKKTKEYTEKIYKLLSKENESNEEEKE